ncbi:uncharacterized protein TrAFT101_010692 [Trichoderma asperellum]|uniref:uncharacterized protein n=1 Tax=Trichoderma asperellum TaxID=101201 RepID=UPI003325DA81|nr:hypothetical protein TrAFT101_010692 [Trichoderma asperellum]
MHRKSPLISSDIGTPTTSSLLVSLRHECFFVVFSTTYPLSYGFCSATAASSPWARQFFSHLNLTNDPVQMAYPGTIATSPPEVPAKSHI